ncbi:disease resistance family protein / LRR family protein [Striga hermonthica]|uniref:Disease resistance family protein / LRR family protein n=1 Tax=Striga hermonthica TaxID=68872 RepID=A0A9N7RRI2_STRHE|nr:disease resistance family protein / LRR family protein [Striga hermonthica]
MFWVLLLLSLLRPLDSISCPEIEKQSLLTFKQSLNGSSNLLPSWDSKVDCCTWEDVVCRDVTGRVLRLDLKLYFLGGKINPSLLNLKHLKYLDLSFNDFHENIPPFIGSLTSLEYLNLEDAGFYGKIPHNIGNLSNLHSLSLGTSRQQLDADSLEWLSGLPKLENLNMNGVNLRKATNWAQQVIYSLPSLVDLQMSSCSLNLMAPLNDVNNISRYNLATLDLSYNSLSYVVIPPWIFQLTNLQYLYLLGNGLSGKISRVITNLCNIRTLSSSYSSKLGGSFGNNMSDCFLGALISLDLSYNQLSGIIPEELGNLLSLEHLYLGNNKLSGNLPESIGKLVNLTALSIDNNMLEGIVTETHIGNLSNLRFLRAAGNHLTLKVDPNWIPPFKLETLNLVSWDLGSQFPLWLETQKESISELDLSSTGINGNVPSWLWSLRYLNLSHNQLDGKILSISNRRNDDRDFFKSFDLSFNRFSGPLPQLMTTSFLELHLSNNSFSGGLSEFVCTTLSNVVIINLEGNHLSGELPECFIKWRSLAVLNLANNKLSGRIPNSIRFLNQLASLSLHGNNFSGHIPSSLQNCIGLVKIDFSDNNLGGDIPKWIDKRFFNLRFLILQSNNFSGEISPSICQLTSLQILDLSNNKLSGKLPQWLNNLTTMTTKRILDRPQYSVLEEGSFQESASISMKGRELIYDANLFLVISIDLSMNNLSGDIPREMSSLVELRTLNLSRNHLTGSIPDNIGNMKELESLDFSMNSISGNIPSSMSIMTTLNYLNLSYNHLTGRIPESTQIGSLNESSFIGNNLCGSPLKISCRSGGNASTPTNVENKGQEVSMREVNWFYVFLSLGYAVGISAVLTTLFFKNKWREAYYAFLQKVWDSLYVYFVVKWRRLMRVLGRNS